MKRRDPVHHLIVHGCRFLREGSRHTVYFNPLGRKTSTIPRHNEIHEFLTKKICKDLEIPKP